MDEFYREIGKLDTETAPLSEIEQARIVEKVCAQGAPKKKRRRLAVLLVAAAIALTACTAAVVNYTDWFTFIASPGSKEVTQQLFSDMGMVIGETVKDEETGVSITLDGCLYDGERMALALTVKGVDMAESNKLYAQGVAEEAWLLSETATERTQAYWQEYYGEDWTEEEIKEYVLETQKIFFGRLSQIYLVSMDENDRTLHLEITTDNHALGNAKANDSMQLYLKNISYRGEVLIPGEFLFTFTLPERDLIKYYTYTGAPLRTENGELTIDKIVLSPSSVRIYCDVLASEEEYPDVVEPSRVRLQDGTTYGFQGWECNIKDDHVTYMRGYYADWQFISPNEVEAICLGEDIWIERSDLEEYTPEEAEE